MTSTITSTQQEVGTRPQPRVGISFPTPFPTNGRPLTGAELIEGAHHREELGFHGIWMADVMGRGYFMLDPLIGLAAVAGATQRVELGTCILQVPLADPVTLARRVLSAALVAQDRLVLGVGAGSTAVDFTTAGYEFAARFKRFDESLATMRALWRGERVGDAQLDPWPGMLGGPPVFIGSWGGSWIDRAATEYDGWIGSGAHATWAEVERAIARYRNAGGGRAVLVSVITDLEADEPAAPDKPVQLKCPPEEARRRLRRLAELGFDDVVLMPSNQSADHLAKMGELAQA